MKRDLSYRAGPCGLSGESFHHNRQSIHLVTGEHFNIAAKRIFGRENNGDYRISVE